MARPSKDSLPKDRSTLAVQVARLYYYQEMTTEAVARELNLSRPAVSRLLTFARQSGLVEIRVHDPESQPQQLEREICDRFKVNAVKVVRVPLNSREDEWLQRVASFAANHLNGLIHSDMTVGIAWGNTLNAVSRLLSPKHCANVDIVQLNGSSSTQAVNNYYTSDIYSRFGQNYGAKTHLFPVPTFFDYPATKQAVWKERSVQRLVRKMRQADLLVYSIGAAHGSLPSYVYVGGYLEPDDFREIGRQQLVGDIATVFFREDGTFNNITLNARASGPDLSLFQRAKHTVCVVSGLGKVNGLRAALRGKLMRELIVDEPTAHALLRE